jgi:hypothetical protein
MNAIIALDAGTGSRTVTLDSYLDAADEERAQIESRRWIKGLRHLQVDRQPLRARFTLRGDSLWWFAEIYLHKQQAILSILRAVLAVDALIERERPLQLRWIRGDSTTAHVMRQRAATRQIRFDGPSAGRIKLATGLAALRVRATMLQMAGTLRLPATRPVPARAPIVAFVHRAFAGADTAARGGEAYIGHVLEKLEARTAPGSLRRVALGPRRNFRARRWWDPVLHRDAGNADAIEQFVRGRALEGSRTVWRQRRRWLRALERSDDVRRHAIICGTDCWPIVREQLTGIAWLQWPWSARAMDQAAAALETLDPAVCVTYAEAGGWGRALALECRRRGIPLVGLQHGFIGRHWLNYLHEPDELSEAIGNPSDQGFPRPSLMLVFDQFAARHLVEAGHLPPVTVRITGSPQRDQLVQAAARLTRSEIASAKQAAGAREDQHLLVLAAKYTQTARVLPSLVEAIRGMPSVHLAIKTHPAEIPSVYAACAVADTTILPATVPLAPLLAAATAVVTVNSTVAIDAVALQVPALVIGLPNNLSPFVDGGAMLGADGVQEIADAITQLVSDESLRTSLLQQGRALTAAPEGGAAEASADAILQLAAQRGDDPKRASAC